MSLMAAGGGNEEQEMEVGLEEGMTWLPSQVLREAFFDTTKTQVMGNRRQRHLHRPKLPPEPPLQRGRAPNRTKQTSNWASSRGSGMQAIFLDSGQKSCGTGVFLPQTLGTNNNIQPTRKPACSPVLLPSRVVQALNLNVHAIASQPSPRQDAKSSNIKAENRNDLIKNNKGSDLSATKCCVVSQNQNSSSPEIFLPKEWTY